MAACSCPILNPLLRNALGSFDQKLARLPAVLHDQDHAGIEIPLRVIHIGFTRAFGGDYILNRYFDSIGFENGMAVPVLAGRG